MQDVLRLGDQRVVILLSDAAGHGVRAAMLMGAARIALHSDGHDAHGPGEILRRINEQLLRRGPGSFVTGLCVLFEPSRPTFQLASTGHPFLWERQTGTGSVVQADSNGSPLGIQASEGYESASVTLEPDDTLVFCTDGVLEARNHPDELFGDQRLVSLIDQHADALAHELLEIISLDVRQ